MIKNLRTSSLKLINGWLQMTWEVFRQSEGKEAVAAMAAIASELNSRWRVK